MKDQDDEINRQKKLIIEVKSKKVCTDCEMFIKLGGQEAVRQTSKLAKIAAHNAEMEELEREGKDIEIATVKLTKDTEQKLII